MAFPKKSRQVADQGQAPEDFLDQFRCGDTAAFDRIVEQFERRLVQFFHRLCWDRGQSEDLTQGVFLKLLRCADRYQPQGRLSTYVFRIATNLWIDHYRSRRPRQPLYSLDQALLTGFDPQAESTPIPSEEAVKGEERQRLRQSLELLTEPHRLVFELAVYQELPYAQIGEVLQIPVGTVKSRMHNSVQALKKIFAAEDIDARPTRQGHFRHGIGG